MWAEPRRRVGKVPCSVLGVVPHVCLPHPPEARVQVRLLGPTTVGLPVVAHERGQQGTVALDVVAHVDELRTDRRHRPQIRTAAVDQGGPIGLPVGGVGGEERIGDPCCSTRRPGGGTTQEERGTSAPERTWGDPHGPAAVLEGLAGPRGPQGLEHLDDRRHTVRQLLAEHRELVGHVPVRDDQLEPTPTELVDHRGVLGDAQRVVEGRDQGGTRARA